MREGWTIEKVEDCCKVQSSKRIFAKDYVRSGIPFYRSKEIIHKALNQFSGDELFIKKEKFEEIKRKFGAPQKGDILISSVGNRSGIPYKVREEYDFYFKDGNLIWLKNFKDNLSSDYLEYYLKSETGQGLIANMMIGAAQKALTIDGVKKIKINLPPLPTQRKIAAILSAYDALIENNLKRIKLLEEKAQLTYEEWFVRLKFPGHENTPIDEETGLPEGWEKVKASEKIKLISGYAFKSKDFTDEPNKHIAIRMGNFKVGGGLKTDKSKYLVDHSTVKEKFHLSHNDLVMVLSDVTREGLLIGNVGLVPNDGINYYLNQRVSKVEIDDNFKMYAYATFNSISFKHNCIAKANSVTVLNLKNNDVYSYKMVVPSAEIVTKWNDYFGGIIKLTQHLERQNQLLKEARDLLLPRLMMGVIEVDELEGLGVEEKFQTK